MKLFFSHNSDIAKTSYINWRTEKDDPVFNLIVLADGYLRSTLELVNVCLIDNSDKKADALIFPIMFNLNHGIELYLKSFIWIINILKGENQTFANTHSLKNLLNTFYNSVEQFEGKDDLKHIKSDFKLIESYLDELYTKIDDSGSKKENIDFSRYPFSRELNDHFYIDELQNITVDLENCKELITEFIMVFEATVDNYYHSKLMEGG